MHFTVVFGCNHPVDLTYGLLFIPCPVWVRGDREILNLHPEDPHYQQGDLRRLLDHEREALISAGAGKQVVVVASPGLAGIDTLTALLRDLRGEGFLFHVLCLPDIPA